MERPANFHDTIADACLPEAAGVVDEAAALDAAVDVLEAHATAGDPTIRGFLRACEGPATRLAGRPADLDVVERQRQAAQILPQAAPGGPGVRGGIGHVRIVGILELLPHRLEGAWGGRPSAPRWARRAPATTVRRGWRSPGDALLPAASRGQERLWPGPAPAGTARGVGGGRTAWSRPGPPCGRDRTRRVPRPAPVSRGRVPAPW